MNTMPNSASQNTSHEPAVRGITRGVTAAVSHYSVHQINSPEELKIAQALRFEVFNLELNEGLASSYETGLDADEFDPVCDHLLVEDNRTGEVVGTYRMQTGDCAR